MELEIRERANEEDKLVGGVGEHRLQLKFTIELFM